MPTLALAHSQRKEHTHLPSSPLLIRQNAHHEEGLDEYIPLPYRRGGAFRRESSSPTTPQLNKRKSSASLYKIVLLKTLLKEPYYNHHSPILMSPPPPYHTHRLRSSFPLNIRIKTPLMVSKRRILTNKHHPSMKSTSTTRKDLQKSPHRNLKNISSSNNSLRCTEDFAFVVNQQISADLCNYSKITETPPEGLPITDDDDDDSCRRIHKHSWIYHPGSYSSMNSLFRDSLPIRNTGDGDGKCHHRKTPHTTSNTHRFTISLKSNLRVSPFSHNLPSLPWTTTTTMINLSTPLKKHLHPAVVCSEEFSLGGLSEYSNSSSLFPNDDGHLLSGCETTPLSHPIDWSCDNLLAYVSGGNVSIKDMSVADVANRPTYRAYVRNPFIVIIIE